MLKKALCLLVVLLSVLLFPGATGIVTGGDATLRGNLEFVSPVVFDGNAIFDIDVCVPPSTGVCPLPKTGTISGGGTIDFKPNMTFTGNVTFDAGVTYNADMYILGGTPVESYPLNTSGTYTEPATPTFEMDFSQTVTNPVTPNIGPALTVYGTPVRVYDSTYPAGLSGAQGYAWGLDGSTTFLSVPNASGGDFANPNPDFSVVCFVSSIAPLIDAHQGIIGKGSAGGTNSSWLLYSYIAKVDFDIFSDTNGYSGAYSEIEDPNGLMSGGLALVVAAYHYVSDTHSIMTLCVNNNSCVSSSTAHGPIFASTRPFVMGAMPFPTDSSAYGVLHGWLDHCAYYNFALSSAQIIKIRKEWNGIESTKLNVLTTVNVAPPAIMRASPNSGVQPFIFALPINTSTLGSFATGQGGIYIPGAKINYIAGRQSFETWGGGAPTGWTSTLGSGSAVTQDTTNSAHGLSGAKITQTGATAVLKSPCSTTNVGTSTVMYGKCYAKKLSGTASCKLTIAEYSDGACATATASEDITTAADLSTSWAEVGHTWSSGSTIGSWQLQIQCAAATAVTDWDACELASTGYATDDVCVNNADTTVVCNASIVSGTYQLGVNNWHINRTVALPDAWSTTTSRYLYTVPATSGNNNKMQLYVNNNVLYWDVYTSAGAKKEATVACAKATHTDVVVSAYHSYAGNIWVCCDSVCGTHVAGATITTPSSTFYLGGDGTVGSDVWVRELDFLN